MTVDYETSPPETVLFRSFVYFQRMVAAVCLGSGLRYWALLSGVLGEDLWRFDLMPAYWQVASAALAVLLPVAAVGLWMPASWGPVVWFVAAAGETIMYLGFPHLFGDDLLTVAIHGAVAVVYAGFRVALFLEKRRARQPVRMHSP